MAHIAFFTKKEFDGISVRENSTGGIQAGTVNLAEALARRGHRVEVYTLVPREFEHNGVVWRPFGQCAVNASDAVIVNSTVDLFKHSPCHNRVLWSRNPITASKIWKQNLFVQILKYRPHGVFLSHYHQNSTSRILPFKSRRIIEHGISEMFWRRTPAANAPAQRVIFTSRPYRGLEWVVEIWTAYIHPCLPSAELHVFSPKGNRDLEWLDGLRDKGIVRRGGLAQSELVYELQNARVLLCPGHRHETYCSAAAEATASGLPVVTRGFGSLAERVRHGETGFIAEDAKEFGARALSLLTDDNLWMTMHRTCLADPRLKSWDDRTREWEEAFL